MEDLTADDLRRLEVARQEFDADRIYLDTATMGLPPRRAWEALQAALAAWRDGTADAVAYDHHLDVSRATYADLVGVDPDTVALGSQVSVMVGLVAASLPAGSEVLTAEGDFASVRFPFHAQRDRGIRVREVPLASIADELTSETALVAVSAVQSADGRVADLPALRAAADATATPVLLDTTQATAWLPIDASQYAYTVCGGYKWLLAPRGTAFLTVQPDRLAALTPNNAGWYAGQERWKDLYGPLRLASTARRFDVSPAWHAWVGQAPSLRLLAELGTDRLHRHALALADRFRDGAGLPPGDSAIVSAVADDEVPALLEQAGIVASVRAGRLRLSCHVSTSRDDVDRALEVLTGHLRA